MAILKKIGNKESFTSIPNKLCQDKNLTYEAKGLLLELLSRPENWVVHKSQLTRSHAKDTKVNRIFKELQEEGYLYIQTFRTEDNSKIEDRNWFVSIYPLNKNGFEKAIFENLNYRKPIVEETSTIENLKLRKPQVEETSTIEDRGVQSKDTVQSKYKEDKDHVGDAVSNDKPTSKTSFYDKNSYPYLLSELLLTLILANKPNFYTAKLTPKGGREKWLQRWAYSIDLMIRVDKISPERIEKVITWCQSDDFWRKNILSTTKLRYQFETLEMKIVEPHKNEEPKDENPQLTAEIITEYGNRILQKTNYLTCVGLKEKQKFVAAAENVRKFSERTYIRSENVVEYLFNCMEARYTNNNEFVMVGHLCSKHTWEILLPQYLKELGINWN